eukprot:CAMPEP_0119073238 /NCGR_PEP_ID=MMETSP1178-20130426/63452_1 /TAXON_ID=33656 /ORGANISM="unid sp, Strain CCMP2000" /LENGTH=51 /DNA_ID=CAMNT_0007055301 /DNA_START=26 /DNA_END=178 /DNA_ORIENTATION=+
MAASHAPPSSGSKTKLDVEWSSFQAWCARTAAPRRGRLPGRVKSELSWSPP